MSVLPVTRSADNLEAWRYVWRVGFAPQFGTAGLEALAVALRDDNPQLLQRATTEPPALHCVMDWPCQGCCPVSWAAAFHAETVGEVEDAFGRACFECDTRLGDRGGCRWLLNWIDETPRATMRAELLAEVEREIAKREPPAVIDCPGCGGTGYRDAGGDWPAEETARQRCPHCHGAGGVGAAA